MFRYLVPFLLLAAPVFAQGSAAKCAADSHYLGCLPPAAGLSRSVTIPLAVGDTARRATVAQVLGQMVAADVTVALGFTPLGAADPALTGRVTVASALSGSSAASAQAITADIVGSGTNGPATAQAGLRVNLTKRNWFAGGAAVGEIDGAYITLRQGGAGSDAAGLLVDAQNTGTGYLAGSEYAMSVVDPTTNTLTRDMGVQSGVLDGVNANYIGHVLNANIGTMSTAMLVQSYPGAAWTNVLRVLKSGIQTSLLDDSGNLLLSGSIRAGVGMANVVRLQGAATGVGPAMAAEGTDANISLVIQPKGAGVVLLGSALQVNGTASLGVDKANFVTTTGAGTGAGPVVSVGGADANIALVLAGKGAGQVLVPSTMSVLLNGVTKVLEVGAPDSGGTGYRMVRVTN